MENQWEKRLNALGWPERAVKQFSFAWANSTKKNYQLCVNKFVSYCVEKQISFPPMSSAMVAGFLCTISDSSGRPESQLKCATAALSWLCDAMDMPNPVHSNEIKKLVTALVKSGTEAPRTRSKVMPIAPFRDLFQSWSDNSELPVKDLRLKAITLFSISAMLRPSDIAPCGMKFEPSHSNSRKMVFSTNNISFAEDGTATINFHGIKNDTTREGFVVSLQPHSNKKLDPIQTVKDYITKTQPLRESVMGSPVFLTLTEPIHALSAQGVATVLSKAIQLAGLGGQGYSAKSFRPTGATAAVDIGFDPDQIMRVGKWKSREVFLEHYVHSRTPTEFVKQILEHP